MASWSIVKPAPFKYIAADSLPAALAAKAEHGAEARFLAGGQSLIPAMNFRLAQPGVLIDINPLAELDYVRDDGALRIGALTRMRTLERSPLVAERQPLLHEAVPHIAHPQIRNRGTLGGNLAHADPASELPAVMLALHARLRLQSVRGGRWIDAKAFFTGALTTALRDDEMLIEVELRSLPLRTGTAFLEVARRRGDYAMMGVAAVVTVGKRTDVRLGFCNAGATPVLVELDHIEDAEAQVQKKIDPSGSVHASKAFQRHLAGVLTRRALKTALARAGDMR
jgi:carbon-monoxide dehydrogenase medium subunit